MKLGFGFYRHMLTPSYYRFARQVDATHAGVHLVDYFKRGKAPFCQETHMDGGEVDILRITRVLYHNGFEGVIIPHHAPQLTCDAPWHAGMAFAMGYLRACFQFVTGENGRAN